MYDSFQEPPINMSIWLFVLLRWRITHRIYDIILWGISECSNVPRHQSEPPIHEATSKNPFQVCIFTPKECDMDFRSFGLNIRAPTSLFLSLDGPSTTQRCLMKSKLLHGKKPVTVIQKMGNIRSWYLARSTSLTLFSRVSKLHALT